MHDRFSLRGGRWLAVATGLALFVGACSESQRSPVSPTATTDVGGAAGVDGSTLKASRPEAVSPTGSTRVDTRRPAMTFTNAVLTAPGVSTPLAYRLEVYEGDTLVATFTGTQTAGSANTAVTPTEDLKQNTAYRWRVRGELEGTFTAWSVSADFLTPVPPPVTTPSTGGGGSVGATRSIGVQEALSIIIAVHNAERVDLGRNSTREQRVAFWQRGVGIVHFGHPTYNPQGGDRDWCIKDAGGGRPISDDVLVRCGNRDSWDTIGGAGADGYSWHLEYLGRLPNVQNVYPPPVPSGAGTLPADPNRPSLPDARGLVQQFSNESPAPFTTQSCPRGLKYVNNPWQDYIVDRLRRIDPRWGYNGKPSRTAADNNGVPVVAAGDELAYYYGNGTALGSNEVYLVDILEGHCGSTPRLTWRVFTGEEPGRWSNAGRF